MRLLKLLPVKIDKMQKNYGIKTSPRLENKTYQVIVIYREHQRNQRS